MVDAPVRVRGGGGGGGGGNISQYSGIWGDVKGLPYVV